MCRSELPASPGFSFSCPSFQSTPLCLTVFLEGRFTLHIKGKYFTKRVVRCWNRLEHPRPWRCSRAGWMGPLAAWSSIKCGGWQPWLQQGGWNLVILGVPSNPSHSMILWNFAMQWFPGYIFHTWAICFTVFCHVQHTFIQNLPVYFWITKQKKQLSSTPPDFPNTSN